MEQEFFKETDITLLKRNVTANSNRDDFYKQVDDDYVNKNLVSISATEYKNMLFQDYFIQRLLANGIQFWPMYDKSKDECIKLYTITANVAKKTINKVENKNKI